MNIKTILLTASAGLGWTYLAGCANKTQLPTHSAFASTASDSVNNEVSASLRPGPDPLRGYRESVRINALLQEGLTALRVEKDAPKAERILRQVLAQDSAQPEAYIALARIMEQRGQDKEALSFYEGLLGPHSWTASQQDDVALIVRYAELCDKYGPADTAQAAYHKVLQLAANNHIARDLDDPNMKVNVDVLEPEAIRARAYVLLGIAFQNHSEDRNHTRVEATQAMLNAYQQAVRLQPDLPIAHYFLAQGLKKARRKQEAQKEFARAEQLGDDTFRTAMHKVEREQAEVDRRWRENNKRLATTFSPTMTANQIARDMAISRANLLKKLQAQGKLLDEKPPIIPPADK